MIGERHIQAFKDACKVHTVREVLEVHKHTTYKRTGAYSPLNELTIRQLLDLLDKLDAKV